MTAPAEVQRFEMPRDVIQRFCNLVEKVNESLPDACARPHDCFCGRGGYWTERDLWPLLPPPSWRHDDDLVTFIEDAVQRALAVRRGPTSWIA